MSQHEFTLTVTSIVVALVLAKLLEGLYQAVRGRLWWVHTAWLLNRLLAVLISVWGYSPSLGGIIELADMSFGRMVAGLAAPLFMLLSAMALVPDRPDTVSDWREHYETIRKPFLALLIATIAANFVNTTMTPGAEVTIPVFLVLLASVVLGLVSGTHWIQAGAVLIHSTVLTLGVVRVVYQ